MIHRTPFFLPWLYPQLVWRIATSEKFLFLTFDDGPLPGITHHVLETLTCYRAPATFFCIGDNVRRHREVFQAVKTGGHEVGNHTRHHLNGWRTACAAYTDNIRACDSDLGFEAPLFRPPYGRISRRQIRAAAPKKIVMWDVLTRDYDQSLSPERCLRAATRALRPGSIIVFHDSRKAERNLTYALPRLLDFALAQGYQFKTLSPFLS
jgi:peptidoglycan/xylan/chitin deacetylase (PgdA/CDA1 family)